ncbi:MAG: IS481 family transposase [Anaerolineaceae bacterium]|jgi:Transposase and inactivated derivatives
MPWIERQVKMLREEFIRRSMEEDRNISALCEEYGISRKTGYKWIKRYLEDGCLEDRNTRPLRVSSKTADWVEKLIIETRHERPRWGAQKIQSYLDRRGYPMPCVRTVNNILKRNGLISQEASLARKSFKHFERDQNNELWQADFKGDLLMGNGERCFPLTILDDHSRYAILIEPKPDKRDVQSSFIRIFRDFGLPESILTDNGASFAGLKGGYTRFERMLMDQDILPIHGRIYHPQTQGKIERFHRSLKNEVLYLRDIQNIEEAEQAFKKWQQIYNFERPHAALGNKCPADIYSISPRQFRDTVPAFDYSTEYRVYRINNWGFLRFADHQVFISETFRDTHIQMIPMESEDSVLVCYRNFSIAKIDVKCGELLSRKVYRLNNSV